MLCGVKVLAIMEYNSFLLIKVVKNMFVLLDLFNDRLVLLSNVSCSSKCFSLPIKKKHNNLLKSYANPLGATFLLSLHDYAQFFPEFGVRFAMLNT